MSIKTIIANKEGQHVILWKVITAINYFSFTFYFLAKHFVKSAHVKRCQAMTQYVVWKEKQ